MWGVAFGSDMIHWFHHVPFSSDSMSSDLFFGSYRNGGLSFDSFRSDDTEDFPCVLNTIHGLTNGKFVAGGFFKRPPCSLCVQWSSRCWCSCGRLYETGKNTTNNAMTSARWLGGRNRPTSVCRTLVKCWQKIEWTRSKPDAWPAHVSLLLFVIYRCFFSAVSFFNLAQCVWKGRSSIMNFFVSRTFWVSRDLWSSCTLELIGGLKKNPGSWSGGRGGGGRLNGPTPAPETPLEPPTSLLSLCSVNT